MLYARALEASQKPDRALEEYREISLYYPGVEARYRLGLALEAAGQSEHAISGFEELLNDATLAPAHFRKAQKKWLALAKERLDKLQH